MSIKFDQKQLQAINTCGNVIVSASAGSGKTTVMVERISRLLKEGKHLRNMLVCTFTRASAADMRGKIHAKIVELVRAGQCDKSELDYLPLADIGTLHSFCRTVTRTYFFAAGFDPTSDIGDENESDSLLFSAVDTAVNNAFEGGDANDLDVINAFGGNADLSKILATAVRFAQSVPEGKGWFDKRANKQAAFDALMRDVDRVRAEFKAELVILRNDAAAVGGKLVKIIEALKNGENVIDGKEPFVSTTLRNGSIEEKVINERFKAFKKEIGDFNKYVEQLAEANTYDGSAGAASLCGMAREAYDLYESKKRAAAIVDYGDLERGALKVLNDEVAFEAISKRYKYIFIDEYQDINPLQDAICRKLGECAETFLVGDPKQSIYMFRHCDPTYFLEALKRDNFHAVRLNSNFRSGRNILDFTNKIFSRAMTVEDGGVDYAAEGMLTTTRTEDGSAELKTVLKPKKDGYSTGIYSVRAHSDCQNVFAENDLIISSIFEFLKRDIDGRAVTYGDIAVLAEKRSAKLLELIESLKQRGIPVTLNGGFKPFIEDGLKPLICVLRAIDNRLDDVPLVGAMRGLFGFTEAELEDIATEEQFHEAVANHNGKYKARIDDMFVALDRFAEYARFLSAAQLTAKVVSETSYFDYMAERGEDVRKLEIFLDYLQDKFNSSSLHAMLSVQGADEISLELPCGQNAISVMTVHSSKGLEFPFVILAHTGTMFNNDRLMQPYLFTSDGLIVKALDGKTLTLKDTAEYIYYSSIARHSEYEQRLRLLYVALTRAQKGLIVTGTVTSNKPPEIKGDSATCLLSCLRPFVAETQLNAEDCVLPAAPEVKRVYVGANEEIANAIAARINFVPPTRFPIKTCVTSIAEAVDEDEHYQRGESLPYIDGDRAGRRGTAYHKAMELVDFHAPDESILENIVDGELVEFARIERAAHAIAERFADYKAYRERSFLSDMPSSLLGSFPSASGGNVLVQGVIDLLLVKGDEAVIIDYKTTELNSIESASYRKQLELYKYAAESALGLKVTDALLYSFVDGKFH